MWFIAGLNPVSLNIFGVGAEELISTQPC